MPGGLLRLCEELWVEAGGRIVDMLANEEVILGSPKATFTERSVKDAVLGDAKKCSRMRRG